MKKKIIPFLMIFLFAGGCTFMQSNEADKYTELELPTGMFYYDLNYGKEYENICHFVDIEDPDEEILGYYVLDAKEGQIVFYEESLYCEKADKTALETYYEDDTNYEWFIEFDKNDNVIRFPIEVTEEEKEKLYSMDQAEREDTLFFSDVTNMATLMMVSKDHVICSKINLLYYNEVWYWQTEVINEDVMKDDYYAEYVHALPDSLIKKINEF